jgi:hypothetical protein
MLRRGKWLHNRRDLLGNYNLFFRQSPIYLFSFAFRAYSSRNRQGEQPSPVRSRYFLICAIKFAGGLERVEAKLRWL